MKLPFTTEQFFSIFEVYNQAIWPDQVLAYLLGLSVIVAIFRPTGWSNRCIAAVLALFWIWTGTVYHIAFFSAINPAARLFGALFIVQGIMLAVYGILFKPMKFGITGGLNATIGAALILYSMLVYPALGVAFGHRYLAVPMFGVTPCPLTIFIFGVFLFARQRIPYSLLLIPLLWPLVGMSAAINLQVPQDYGLMVSGILGSMLLFASNRKRPAL